MPYIRRNDGDAAAGVRLEAGRDLPGSLNARPPAVPVGLVAGLRIDDKLLNAIHAKKARGAMSALGYWSVDFPAQTVVQGETVAHLPGVLQEGAVGVAADSRGPDVGTVGELARRDGNGVRGGAAGKESADGVGKQVADRDVVGAALREDVFCGVGGAAAEVVFAIGADAEIGGIAIETRLDASLDDVTAPGPGDELTTMKEISIGLHDRTPGRVECLEGSVVELDCRVGQVRRGKAWRAAGDADQRFEDQARRCCMCPGSNHIALMIDVRDAEGWIDGGLIWIGGGPGEVIEINPGEKLVFRRNRVIDSERELIGVGDHLGRGRIRIHAVGARRQVGQRIACQDRADQAVYWHVECVCDVAAVRLLELHGIGDDVLVIARGTLLCSRHWENLRGAEDLAKPLILAEVEGPARSVVDVRQNDGATVGKAELVTAKRRNAPWGFRRCVIEEVARVEGGVADKFEDGTMKTALARASDDVGESRGAAPDLGGHPAGAGLDLFHRVDIEVGEGCAAHLRVAGIRAIRGEDRFHAALAVDSELLREVGGAVGVGHRARGQQQQLAEIALVQRQRTDRMAGKLFSAGGRGLGDSCRRNGRELESELGGIGICRGKRDRQRGGSGRQADRFGVREFAVFELQRQPVGGGGNAGEAEAAVGSRDGGEILPLSSELDRGSCHRLTRGVMHNARHALKSCWLGPELSAIGCAKEGQE